MYQVCERTASIDGDCIILHTCPMHPSSDTVVHFTVVYTVVQLRSSRQMQRFSLTRPTFDDRQLIDMIPVRVIKLSEQPIPTLTPFRQWVHLLFSSTPGPSVVTEVVNGIFLLSPPEPEPPESPLTSCFVGSLELTDLMRCPFEAMLARQVEVARPQKPLLP